MAMLWVCPECWNGRQETLDKHVCRADQSSCIAGIFCPNFMVICHCPCDEVASTKVLANTCTH